MIVHRKGGTVASDQYILIQAQLGHDVSDLASRVMHIPGIASAERVLGAYDVIASVRDQNGSDRGQDAETAIRELEGVLRAISLPVASDVSTETLEDPKEAA
jgi:hypothetical protein